MTVLPCELSAAPLKQAVDGALNLTVTGYNCGYPVGH